MIDFDCIKKKNDELQTSPKSLFRFTVSGRGPPVIKDLDSIIGPSIFKFAPEFVDAGASMQSVT
jgi:hypothetical protein